MTHVVNTMVWLIGGEVEMKKMYVMLAVTLVFFMFTSTIAVASVGSLSSSSESVSIDSESASSTESSSSSSTVSSQETTSSTTTEEVSSGDTGVTITQESTTSGSSTSTSDVSDGGSGDLSIDSTELLTDGTQPAFIDNIPPVADFIYYKSPDNVYEFNFVSEGYSYDEDGEIIYWRWSFNDGSEVSYEQNPSHVFDEGLAGHEIKIILMVGDDGDPQLYGSKEATIDIPQGIDIINEGSGYTELVESEEQVASQSTPRLVSGYTSSSQTTADSALQSTVYKATQIFGNSQILSQFLSVINSKTETCSMGGDCDLYIYDFSYSPNPPKMNKYVTVSTRVGNEFGVYSSPEVTLTVSIPGLGVSSSADVPFDDQTHSVEFKWPDGATGEYDMTLRVDPLPLASWTDIDSTDDSYTWDGISAQVVVQGLLTGDSQTVISISSPGGQTIGSTTSTGMTGATQYYGTTQYGSFSL